MKFDKTCNVTVFECIIRDGIYRRTTRDRVIGTGGDGPVWTQYTGAGAWKEVNVVEAFGLETAYEETLPKASN